MAGSWSSTGAHNNNTPTSQVKYAALRLQDCEVKHRSRAQLHWDIAKVRVYNPHRKRQEVTARVACQSQLSSKRI